MKRNNLDIIREYREKYPRAMKLTLAKLIHADHPETSIENWRTSIRYYSMSNGEKNRDSKDSSPSQLIEFMDYIQPDHEAIPEPLKLTKGKAFIICDTHGFNHSTNTKEYFERAKEEGCDTIILNGDIMDFESLTRWPLRKRAIPFQEEVDMIRELLSDIQFNFPKAKKIYKKGNHEDWFDRQLWNNPALMASDDFANMNKIENIIKPEEFGFEFVQSRQVIWLGKLLLIHGHEAKRSGMHIAKSIFEYFKCDVAFGHFHRYDHFQFDEFGGKRKHSYSLPCARDFNVCYTGINNQWSSGFAICEFTKDDYEMSVYIEKNGKIKRQ